MIAHADVLIVGGGPAGAACAWQLRRHNIKVLILEKETFPRLKLCAGWITPHVFHLLGVKPQDYPHGLTHFSSFQVSIKKIRFTLPTHQYAIRRIEFDHWLLQRADVETVQHIVKEIHQEGNEFIIDDRYSAPILVGAGGTWCPVRKTFFPSGKDRMSEHIVALEQEFQYPVSDDRCFLWFFENHLPGYAWYVPKTGGYVNVGIGASAAGLKSRGATLKEHWNLLLQKIEGTGLIHGYDFTPKGYSYYLRHKGQSVSQENIYLLGDAAGLATRDMGEGIGPAIESGILAAKAIVHHSTYNLNSISRFSLPALLKK